MLRTRDNKQQMESPNPRLDTLLLLIVPRPFNMSIFSAGRIIKQTFQGNAIVLFIRKASKFSSSLRSMWNSRDWMNWTK